VKRLILLAVLTIVTAFLGGLVATSYVGWHSSGHVAASATNPDDWDWKPG